MIANVLRFLFILILSLGLSAKNKQSKKRRKNREKVTIEPWEYCHGCRITVDSMVKRTARKLAEMQAAQVEQGQTVEASDLANGLCEDQNFDGYRPFAKYACMKIIEENSTAFLLPFRGTSSSSMRSAKGDIYEKTKEICVDEFNTCSERVFEKGNIPASDRNKCSACSIIAYDLETANKIFSPKISLRETVENICEGLGYNHKPYAWIESYCDEIIEENTEEILETMVFRNRILKTGSTPEKPLSHLLCRDLYGCDLSNPSGSQRKQNSKRDWKNNELR